MLYDSIPLSAIAGGLHRLAAAVTWPRRIRPAIALVPPILIACLAIPVQASAVEVRGGERVTVAADETVENTLVLMGQVVTVEGTVEGDLIAFANRIEVGGVVRGNAYLFSQTLQADGTIEGNVHVFAQTAEVAGQLGRNGFLFGQVVDLAKEGRIAADAFIFGQAVGIPGEVGRDALAFGEAVTLTGKVGGDFQAEADKVSLLHTAHVGGDLRAEVPAEEALQIEAGATVVGETSRTVTQPSRFGQTLCLIWTIAMLLGALPVGWLLFRWFPGVYPGQMGPAGSIILSVGVGLLTLVALPVLAGILAITLIGMPLALIGLGLWVLGLYLSKIVVAASLGRAVIRSRPGQSGRFLAGLLLGLLILLFLSHLPVAGGVINFLVVLLGLGVLVRQVVGRRRRPEAAMI